jgi:glycosyltransferase involved in cell wall biosynthesis
MRERRIGISLGNLGNLHDGLGEFAVQMGTALAAAAPRWAERDSLHVDFHLRAEHVGLFGPDVGYLPVSRWHRYHHVQPQHYELWHSLHQVNKTLPPAGAGQRLVTIHDLNYVYGRKGWASWRQQRRAQAMVRRTDLVVAISQHTASDVRQHLGWTGPTEVILRGARPFAGGPQEPLPGWPADGQDGDGKPFLFHLSRMSPSKNPQAIIGLARQWPDMTFIMSGPDGGDTRALRDATRLPNVQFHLSISDAQKAWAFAHCAGFLFPSWTEGFGLPPIEAMQFGKAVFLSRLTSLPEIGGDAADYFDDFAPEAMRRVVEAGLARQRSDPARPAAIRAHAARFDADRAAAEYLALYRRLLNLPAER